MTHRLLASTTSHKREPLISTLEVFARLGLTDLDLNLHHFIEGDLPVDVAAAAVATDGQHVWVASGGCGASLVPEICRDIVSHVDRPNIRINFDPINFGSQ